jgi:hypothetical protein
MSNENKVTVRVEVVVETAGQPSKMTAELFPPFRGITSPTPSPANTTVYLTGSQYSIAASGGSPVVMGSYAKVVKAMAYPRPDATPQQSGLGSPPSTAVTGTLLDGGRWSFSQANNNLVPGAHAPDNYSGDLTIVR